MSNILIRFAEGIINYLFIASLLAVVLTLLLSVIIRITRIRAPIYRHMIWQYALIGIVLFPVVWISGPILTLEILPAVDQPANTIPPEMDSRHDVIITRESPAETHPPDPIASESTVMNHAIPPRPFPAKAMLAGIWLYGTIVMLIRLCVGWFRLRRICLSAESVSGNRRIESQYGERLRILLTSQVDGHVCFSLWQPVILLPRVMYNDSSTEDLKMALSHELAHIERRDCRTNLLQRVIEAIFFFHPFVWYASLQLTQQREQICDNYVIHKGVRVMDYSKFLSRIAEQGFEKTQYQAVALFEGRLLQRVHSLLDPKRSNQISASRWAVLVGAVAVTACLIFGAVRLEAKPNSNSDSTNSPINNYSAVPQREILRPGRPKGNCSISGQVISAESGKPVGHALVCLSTEAGAPIFIEVAGDGTFVFKDIPSGPFRLNTMNTAGFQDVYYNPQKRHGKYPEFSLKDKEQRSGIILKVTPACSIAGRIFDENGDPIRDRSLYVQVWVEVDQPEGNRKRYSIAESRRIASDGSYSLDGLDGRPVYVMAIDLKSEEKDEFYPPCYYPGTVDRNKAKKVSFDETTSVEQIDIHLQKKGEFVLEGVVTDEKTGIETKPGQKIKDITSVIQ